MNDLYQDAVGLRRGMVSAALIELAVLLLILLLTGCAKRIEPEPVSAAELSIALDACQGTVHAVRHSEKPGFIVAECTPYVVILVESPQ